VIASSEIVISRPGYSTIMDLARLGKRAVFVPTPGQTEQEYLGKRMMKNRIAFCMPQHGFDLSTALSKALQYEGFRSMRSDDLLKKALNSLFK
jgi:UDP-N-acetylglucosamine:LPS N-acetylglucosamine transferase